MEDREIENYNKDYIKTEQEKVKISFSKSKKEIKYGSDQYKLINP
jgi:hypothetical protein